MALKKLRRAVAVLAFTAAAAGSSVVLAPAADAVTGCTVWAATDNRAYAQCSGGSGYQRAGAACAWNGIFVGSAYGQWVKAGQVSVADCSYPRKIDFQRGRHVVWWETK